MNKTIEYVAMALGGLSLFAMCFLAFASLAGVPLRDVPLLGSLAPEPPTQEETGSAATESGPPAQAAPPATADEVLAQGRGVLGAWALDSPFTHEELRSLADGLKLKRAELDQRLREVGEREEVADQREATLTEQFQTLEEMRKRMEADLEELELRAAEVARDERVAREQAGRRWQELAKIFAEQAPAEAAQRLLAYGPEDAAKILRFLEETAAREVLNSLDGDAFLEYAEAYSAAVVEAE